VPLRIAENLGCGSQTVRNAIHDFNERGLGALQAGSSRPKEVHAAFDAGEAESLRQMLHQPPSNFGKESTFWTLAMAAEVSFEEGITERQVSGETIRTTLARLGVRWERAKRWIESPDPEYARKKGIEIG
jgi:transposase